MIATYNLGCFHYEGRGVNQDYTEAVRYFRKAAEQGYHKAQYNLGVCYYYGKGVKPDMYEAKYWIRKAALQDHPEAVEMARDLNIPLN